MSVKYFEYNNNPNGEKYMEVTKEEFQRDVIETEGRFYISFGTSVFECSYEDYKKEEKRKRHVRYISAIADGVYPRFTELTDRTDSSQLTITEEEMFERAENNVLLEIVLKYVARFPQEDQKIFKMVIMDGKSQEIAGDTFGKSQQCISYKIKSMLGEITEFLKI